MGRIVAAKISEDKEIKDKKIIMSGISASVNISKTQLQTQKADVEKVQKEKQELENIIVDLKSDIKILEDKKTVISDAAARAKADLKTATKELSEKYSNSAAADLELKARHDELEERLLKSISDKEKQVVDLDKKIADLKKQYKDLDQESTDKLSNLTIISGKSVLALKKTKEAETKFDDISDKHNKLINSVETVNTKLKTLQTTLAKEQADYAEFKKTKNKEKVDLEKSIKEKTAEEKKLQDKIDTLLQSIASVGRREQNCRNEEIRLGKMAKRLGVSLAL